MEISDEATFTENMDLLRGWKLLNEGLQIEFDGPEEERNALRPKLIGWMLIFLGKGYGH